MSQTFEYYVDEPSVGLRLDVYISTLGVLESRSQVVKLIEDGFVFVNGIFGTKNTRLKLEDCVSITVPEKQAKTSLQGENIPLDVRYEDESLLVISKQIGLVCHPSEDHLDGTLVNALIYHCGAQNLCDVQGESDRLGIVHRLDMDTSGLMLAVKTNDAGLALMNAIADKSVDRRYIALVHGNIAPDTGMIDAPIARSVADRKKMCVRECESSRDAITSFTTLARFEAGKYDNGYTLVECKLFTGRTHQIRVHLEYIKHPLVGEQVYRSYAPKKQDVDLGLNRQFLHSYSLIFEHPITHEVLTFKDTLGPDLQETLHCAFKREYTLTEMGKSIVPKLFFEGCIPWE